MDKSLSIDVVLKVLDELFYKHNESCKYVCLLQPTSLLRSASKIGNCMEMILKADCESVVSLTLVDDPHPLKRKLLKTW